MRLRLVALVVTLAVAAACGGERAGGDADRGATSGTVRADGSSTVFPITEAVAEEFQRENPGVRVPVGQSGTGGGFEKFCNGETDVSNASREIDAAEAAACKEKGIEFVGLKVAIDGLSVVVNSQNDFVGCLTVDQLKKMWEPNSRVETWRDVDPSWPARPIKLYGPGADSGTFDYFTDEIVGEEGSSRNDYTASEDDNVLVQGVAGDENALGYFGFAYYEQNEDKLETVAVDSGSGCVEPTRQSIESGRYEPLSRPLLVYASKQALDRPEVAEFLEFYVDNVSALVADVGYIALPEEDLEASKNMLAAAVPG